MVTEDEELSVRDSPAGRTRRERLLDIEQQQIRELGLLKAFLARQDFLCDRADKLKFGMVDAREWLTKACSCKSFILLLHLIAV